MLVGLCEQAGDGASFCLKKLPTSSQNDLEFQFISDWDPLQAGFGNTGLERPGDQDRIRVHSNQVEPSFLVETDRRQVVIGGNQPQALATGLLSHFFYSLDQRTTDPYPGRQAIQRDDLALVRLQVVGDKPGRLALVQGNESRQLVTGINLASTDNSGATPSLAQGLVNPGAESGCDSDNLDGVHLSQVTHRHGPLISEAPDSSGLHPILIRFMEVSIAQLVMIAKNW